MKFLIDLGPVRRPGLFRVLLAIWFLNQCAQHITATTIGFQVYVATGSSMAVGVISLATFVPLAAVALSGGILTDLFGGRATAAGGLVASSGFSMTMAGLSRSENSTNLLLYAVAVAHASLFASTLASLQSLVPTTVSVDSVPSANALVVGTGMFAMAVGPLTAGFLIASNGAWAAHLGAACALSVAASLLLLFPSTKRDLPARNRTRASLSAGLRAAHHDHRLLTTLLLDSTVMILAQPRALLPAIALTVYVGDASTLGLMQSAPAIGALFVVMFSGWITRASRFGLILAGSAMVYSLAMAASGAVTAFGGPLVPFLVLLSLFGAADLIGNTFRFSVFHTLAPPHLAGRLQSVLIVAMIGGPRLGDFLAGTLSSLVPEAMVLVVGGTSSAVAISLLLLRDRNFTKARWN